MHVWKCMCSLQEGVSVLDYVSGVRDCVSEDMYEV